MMAETQTTEDRASLE